ncbi:MAG: C4-dicarboxylate TRAP transporter substrate-binding protein [Alphaproteobacteria bacterium]
MTLRKTMAALAGMAAVAMIGGPAPVKAETVVIKLTIGSSHPTKVPWVGVMKSHVQPELNKRLKAMGSKYTIKWTEGYAGALYNFKDTLEAVEKGLVDIGWVGTLWEDSKMPLQNVTYHTPFVTDDLPALMKLFNKLSKDNPAMKAAWTKRNQVLLGASGIETYHILSKTPIKTLADLKGKKFMAAGAVGSWLKGSGAIPVNGGLPGFYNAMKTGVADGAIIPFSGAFPFKLYEVAPYITKVSLGAQYTGGMAINLKTWKKLPPVVQKLLRQLGAEYSLLHSKILIGLATKFEGIMAKKGAKISTLDPKVRMQWAKKMPHLGQIWVKSVSAKGLPAQQLMSAYMNGVRAFGGKPLRAWDK